MKSFKPMVAVCAVALAACVYADEPAAAEAKDAPKEGAAPKAEAAQMPKRERPLAFVFTKDTKSEDVEAFKKSVLERIDKMAKDGEGRIMVLSGKNGFRPGAGGPGPRAQLEGMRPEGFGQRRFRRNGDGKPSAGPKDAGDKSAAPEAK